MPQPAKIDRRAVDRTPVTLRPGAFAALLPTLQLRWPLCRRPCGWSSLQYRQYIFPLTGTSEDPTESTWHVDPQSKSIEHITTESALDFVFSEAWNTAVLPRHETPVGEKLIVGHSLTRAVVLDTGLRDTRRTI